MSRSSRSSRSLRPCRDCRAALIVLAAAALPALLHGKEPPEEPGSGNSASSTIVPLPPEPFPGGLRFAPSTQGLGGGGLFESRSPWSLPRLPEGTTGVRSASYPVDAGAVRVVPTVVVLPDPRPAAPGLVGLGLEHAVAGDPLRWKAQLGWSGVASGSFEAEYRETERNVVLKGEDRPALAALLPGGRAPGTSVESRWSERLGAHTSANATLASHRLEPEGRAVAASAGGVELTHRPVDHWTILARVDRAAYSDATTAGYRRGVVTVGTGFDGSGIGARALYRNEASSSADGGGHGGRVSVRAGMGGVTASAFADVQQQAEELEVLVRNPAELPGEFTDLGLVGLRPEAAVETLRDRPTLFSQHGITTGALRTDPLRVQGGVQLAWRPSSSSTEFGVRVAYDELDGATGPRRAVLGSLYTSWRVFSGVSLSASYANWSLRDGGETDERGAFRMSVRAPL